MPWHVQKRGDKFCVFKGSSGTDGPVVKCHNTRPQAEAHMRALYANDKEKSVKTATNSSVNTNITFDISTMEQELKDLRSEVRGERIRLYFQEGERTPDLRVIDPNATNFNRPPPFAIRLQTTQPESGGHAGAVVCGVIDRIMRDGLTIVAEGRLDLNSQAGQEAERLIREGIMQTWSPDLGDATIDWEENVEDEDGESPQDALAHFVKATFLGATLVAMPALASAVVELLDAEGKVLVPAPVRQVAATDAVGESHDPDENKVVVDRVAACAGPQAPPASFFSDPELTEPQRFITVTPEGRVFGHLACWGECHIGYGNTCIEPPSGGTYSYFHIGQVRTAEGNTIATGPLTLKGGHAAQGLSAEQAQAHYDDTRSAVADVVLGEDEIGIWFSGALRPDITEQDLRAFRASGVSGDWRRLGGRLELVGACSVNVPGFPKVSVRLVAAGEESEPELVSLVAAGGRPEPALTDDCACADCSDEQADLTVNVVTLTEELAAKIELLTDFVGSKMIEDLEADLS